MFSFARMFATPQATSHVPTFASLASLPPSREALARWLTRVAGNSTLHRMSYVIHVELIAVAPPVEIADSLRMSGRRVAIASVAGSMPLGTSNSLLLIKLLRVR
jgi:hypothetical protein